MSDSGRGHHHHRPGHLPRLHVEQEAGRAGVSARRHHGAAVRAGAVGGVGEAATAADGATADQHHQWKGEEVVRGGPRSGVAEMGWALGNWTHGATGWEIDQHCSRGESTFPVEILDFHVEIQCRHQQKGNDEDMKWSMSRRNVPYQSSSGMESDDIPTFELMA